MELTMAYLLESQIEGCPFQVAEFHKRMKCQMPCRGQSLMLVATWSGMALCRALGRFRSLLLCLDNLAPSQHSRPNWLRGELAEALRQPCSTDFSFFLSFSILLLVLLYAFVFFSFAFRFLCFTVGLSDPCQSAMQLSISPVDDEDFGGKLACSVCYAVAVPNCSASGRFSGSQGELPGGDDTGQVRTHQEVEQKL